MHNPAGTYSLEDINTALRQAGAFEDSANAAAEDESASLLAGDTAREIHRRAALLGSAYPFSLEGVVVNTGDWIGDGLVYSFLLLLTRLPRSGRRSGLITSSILLQRLLAAISGATGSGSNGLVVARCHPIPKERSIT